MSIPTDEELAQSLNDMFDEHLRRHPEIKLAMLTESMICDPPFITKDWMKSSSAY